MRHELLRWSEAATKLNFSFGGHQGFRVLSVHTQDEPVALSESIPVSNNGYTTMQNVTRYQLGTQLYVLLEFDDKEEREAMRVTMCRLSDELSRAQSELAALKKKAAEVSEDVQKDFGKQT